MLQYEIVASGRPASSDCRVLCLFRVATVILLSDTSLIQRDVQIVTLLVANLPGNI